MNKKFFLPLCIAACHIPIFFLHFPTQKQPKKRESNIAVRTIHLIEEVKTPPAISSSTKELPSPKKKKVTQKKVATKNRKKQATLAKKKVAQKKTVSKRPKQPRKKRAIQKDLGKSLVSKAVRGKKIVRKTKNGSSTKKSTKNDAGKEQREYNQYLQTVVSALKDSLTLPETGRVKLTITVSEQGKIVKIVSLLVESENNLAYLKENLAKMTLPAYAKKENRTFTIVFCDEK